MVCCVSAGCEVSPLHQPLQVMEILREYKGDSPMYDLNDKLKEQMSLPLDVTFSDLKSQVAKVGDGTWRVFHAPHLVGLSRLFFSTVNPVQYRLEGQNIYSNVKFIHPLLGTMWLSASGAACIAVVTYHAVREIAWGKKPEYHYLNP